MNDSSLPQGTRPTLALSVTGLTKHYDSGFTLDDVTFDLPSGYIMGLVGPNGAGKSTLIKLILNMTTRDAGRIEVLGLDAMADEERAKEQLGVVLDSSYFIEYMTVDALVRTQDIPHIGGTDGLLTQHASIEDVIRLTNAAAHTAIGNTNEGDVR